MWREGEGKGRREVGSWGVGGGGEEGSRIEEGRERRKRRRRLEIERVNEIVSAS